MEKSFYTIHVCSRCRSDGQGRPVPGAELMRMLASRSMGGNVQLAQVDCMAGCDRPLVVGFTASRKASYLFADIDPARDADALLAFGVLYSGLEDGWCNESVRPDALRGKTVARLPAAEGRVQ